MKTLFQSRSKALIGVVHLRPLPGAPRHRGTMAEIIRLALADAVAYAVVVDAFTHPGAADPSRIARSVCGQLFLPGVTVESFAEHFATVYVNFMLGVVGLPYPTVSSEPPLRCYALPKGCAQ